MTENKNITIALGVICIILAASLVVVVANGTFSSGNQADTSNLENQVTSLTNQVNSLNSKISDYEEQIDEITNENDYYTSVIALEEHMEILNDSTYTQDANTETELFNDDLYCAGYIEIQAESTSDTTYIQISYTYNTVEFNQKIPVGTDGTISFPVLPCTTNIILGNADTETNTATITMTYFY